MWPFFPFSQGAPKPVAMEPCSGGKAAVLTVLLHLPSGPSGLPPPGQSGQTALLGDARLYPSPCFVLERAGGEVLKALMSIILFLPSGLIVASALVDVSQQKPSDFKDKTQSLKNRKALPPALQGTCVWVAAPPSTGSFSPPSERRVAPEASQYRLAATTQVFRFSHICQRLDDGGKLPPSRLSLRQVSFPSAQTEVTAPPRGPTCAPTCSQRRSTCQYVCTLSPEGKGNVSLLRGSDHHLTLMALLPFGILFCIMLASKWYSKVLNLPFCNEASQFLTLSTPWGSCLSALLLS